MSGVGRRGEGPLSLCLPILPLPGGLKVPPSRAKGGGGDTATVRCVTRRQMSPPPSAAACEVRGERCAHGGDGRDSVTLGTAAGDRDTDTDHRVLWGHRGRGQQGSLGCSREAETCFWRGEERRGQLGGGVSPSRSSVSVPTEHTKAVPLVTRTRPELPARWEHLLGERRSQSLPQVHSGDKHPKSRWGAQTGQAVTPHCPHTSPLPPSCLHAPHPLPAPPARRSVCSPSLPTPHPQPPWLFSMAERDV